ncbi:uncharacterized protein LOC108733340 [Agrilus planipennis]|uniref:Uncharacterized protein LOC108733340 n=1 Tax=Agrilus planipennis TaxID=224129 RepID=A0A1W4W776_AGRPL|nr:uncharacterized protein LOC108733340 [Agrilus planipennis]
MNIMTGDPYNKRFPQTLSEYTNSCFSNPEFGMHSQQEPVTAPNPDELGFSRYNENYSPFQMGIYDQCQVPASGPFQFNLPNLLSSTSNSFLFSSSQSNAPQGLPSSSVVHFPFANDAFTQPSYQKNLNNFTEKLNGAFSESSKFMRDIYRCKRKPESIDLPPFKQHITEEKMAESMSRLHINSETPVSCSEPEDKKMQRLYMCDEMRRLQAESIIPHQILSKIARPCTALVPWTPPVVSLPGTSGVSNNGGNDNNNNNNNDDELDNYTSDSDKSAIEIEVEPNPNMDLDL